MITKQDLIKMLADKGYQFDHGAIQLFTDQNTDYYSVSINFTGTSVHIPKDEIDRSVFADDEQINIYRTWECNV